LLQKGDRVAAHRALEDALRAAESIGLKRNRDSNVERIQRTMRDIESKAAGVNSVKPQ